ncbi:MAG: C-terminal binding protein [Clostridioides sp.]|jgi:D-3-phosphoglycerate dehydrogenase|nr:C-terminal binding protein [Clostridioides sp.]
MKVVLLDSQVISGYDYSIEQKIFEDAGFEFVKETCKNEDEVIEKCLDADAILNICVKMTEKSINQLEKCQVLVRYGIGYDEFDVEAATKRGIKVCNVSKYCIPEVALHATTLILSASRQILHFTTAVRNGLWNKSLGNVMKRPSSQTIGLIGFGNISRTVASNLKGIGYNVVAYDPFLPDSVFKENNVVRVELDELYKISDIISTHVPQTDETYHILNKSSFEKMKDGVIIVNTARGGLICQEDLIDALDSGKVGAVGLDVLDVEPMTDVEHTLCKRDNVILTPHIAYNSAEASNELFEQVATTAVAVLNGEVPDNVVNKKALSEASLV